MAHTLVNLRAEAIAEVGRLARARSVIRDGDQGACDRLEGDATWVAISRRARLRRALRGRLCLIWRATLEDASGRIVESHLVPLLVDLMGARFTPWLQHAEHRVGARVEADSERWRAEVVRVNGAFAAARLARERTIVTAATGASTSSQPGLFDRRAERCQQDRTFAAAGDEQALAERRDRLAAAAVLVSTPARLLLVLVP